jgi:hypothetical protein
MKILASYMIAHDIPQRSNADCSGVQLVNPYTRWHGPAAGPHCSTRFYSLLGI